VWRSTAHIASPARDSSICANSAGNASSDIHATNTLNTTNGSPPFFNPSNDGPARRKSMIVPRASSQPSKRAEALLSSNAGSNFSPDRASRCFRWSPLLLLSS
jgi:hypothetical protein